MSIRETHADAGARDARELLEAARRDLRAARVAAGLSQKSVAHGAGLSNSVYGRVERGELALNPVEYLSRAARAVGLELSVRLYPGGAPVRDAGQLRLEADYRAVLGASLTLRSEVPLPIEGDPRAWDAMIRGTAWRVGVEAETRPRDAQALIRRISLKARDDGAELVLLVLADTRNDRAFARAAADVLGARFPVDGPRTLDRLSLGLRPEGDAIVLL